MDSRAIPTTDLLALERTKLANERTFLAYFRTFVVFLSSGFAIFKIDMLRNLATLGYFFMVAGVVLLAVGLVRFYQVKRRIGKYFK